MANVVLFEPNQIPSYLQSVNTPDYEGNANAVIDPNISAVSAVPLKYWKRGIGKNIVQMIAAEKQAVDDAELLSRKSQADQFNVGNVELITALIKVINIKLPSGQKITKQELIDAVKAEVT